MASVSTIITTAITALGAAIKGIKDLAGATSALATTNKTDLVSAINETHGLAVAAGGATAALIDDASGVGVTAKTWSADKSATEIATLTTAMAAMTTALGDLNLDVSALVAATQA